MATIVAFTLIGTAALGFLVRFFIALCKEQPSERCHVVHILTRFDGLKRNEDWWGDPNYDAATHVVAQAIGAGSPQTASWRAPVETIPSTTLRRAR
jgi:hypothetical protein